jgi:hypothetical protein
MAVFAAQAQSDSHWSLSGFGTAGVVKQNGASGLGFVRNRTQRGAGTDLGAAPDSRAGLQLNWNGGPQWEAGAQGVLVQKPAGTPVQENIEWAYLGYRPWPNTRIRLGRTSPDLFLFAESRNVGFALPWARPPVDFYGFAPLVSIDGADLEQRWFTGNASWRARATAGAVRTSVIDNSGSRLTLHGANAFAMGLSREEGGLLVKVSFLRSRIEVNANPQVGQLLQGLNQLAAIPVPGLANAVAPLGQNLWTGGMTTYLALAAQYETGPWTFIAEGSRLRVPGSALNADRAYVSAGYRSGSVTYYGTASRVKPDDPAVTAPALAPLLTPVIGPAAAAQAQALAGYAGAAGDSYRYDQSTVGVGLRWDFSPNAALKLQVDRFDVHRHGGAGWRSYDGRATQGTLVSMLVDFVWGQ